MACASLKVHELSHRGVTLEALLNFYVQLCAEETKTKFGFTFEPEKHTTANVVIRGLVV